MRSYHELVEVRRGLVAGQEAPEQFFWRDRLWLVRDVIAHWVETGAWWEQPGVAGLLGREAADREHSGRDAADREHSGRDAADREHSGREGGGVRGPIRLVGVLDETARPDLLAEQEVWRVEAGRRSRAADGGVTTGVFDISYDPADGRWRLICAVD